VKRVERNPALLIINPQNETQRRAWRNLRSRFGFDRASKEYARRFKVNPQNLRDLPDFKKAVKLYRQFHGIDPKGFSVREVPQLGETKTPIVMVPLGGAVSESYTTDQKIPKSKKTGSIYVHKYPEKRMPLKVVTADGKLIMTMPAGHKVKDWIYG